MAGSFARVAGWPGVPGATWWSEGVSFLTRSRCWREPYIADDILDRRLQQRVRVKLRSAINENILKAHMPLESVSVMIRCRDPAAINLSKAFTPSVRLRRRWILTTANLIGNICQMAAGE